MAAPDWLTARPIAHRGLHDRTAGIPENTLAAADAAVARGYAIECDVQISRDGEAVVFHDEALGRLTEATERTDSRDAADLARLAIMGTAETIPALGAFLGRVAGRVPVIVEVKTQFRDDLRLARRVAEVALAYAGPVALKSFDPRIVGGLADFCPGLPRGIVAERSQTDPSYARLTETQRFGLANLLHLPLSRPDFLSWRVDDLPGGVPFLCRHLGRMPVMAWTVRREDQRANAAAHADQMVFEGFLA